MSTENELTLEDARVIVEALDNPLEWRNYAKRSSQQRQALGIVILHRIMKGQSLRTIESELGIPRATVARYRDLALSAVALPTVEEARKEELDRLDILIEAVWASATTGDDKAIASYIKLSDKRAALLGLNKPIQVEQTVHEITPQEAELKAMIAQAERDAKVAEDQLAKDFEMGA